MGINENYDRELQARIQSGETYPAREDNILGGAARVVSVGDGVVRYEHISPVVVTLCTSVEAFAECWDID